MFYKGEQVGERRYFDERLTMFLLRLRDPARFGTWRDRTDFQGLDDDDLLARRADASVDQAEREEVERERKVHRFVQRFVHPDDKSPYADVGRTKAGSKRPKPDSKADVP